MKSRPSGSKPSVVSAMNPTEFPFPSVSSTAFNSKALDMPFITDARHLPVPDMNMGKFLVIPYDDSAPALPQRNTKQEEAEPEAMQTRYHAPVQSHTSIKHRASCHRCGNLRKKNVLCSRCPHTFCQRCAEKMQEEHGMDVFNDGCPVCKDLCCCGKNRSLNCTHKYHCYKKCPLTKRNRQTPPDQYSPPAQMMLPNSGAPYYTNMMNMMTPPMHGLNTGYYPPQTAMFDNGPQALDTHTPISYKPYTEPEWPRPAEPQKAVGAAVVLGKHANVSSAEDTTSASEFEDLLEDESLQAFKRTRFDTSPSANTSSDEEFFINDTDADLLALLSEDDSFFVAMQALDAPANKQEQPSNNFAADGLSFSDEQLLSFLQF